MISHCWLCLTFARRKRPTIQSYGHTVRQLRGYTIIQWYDLSLLAVSDLCKEEAPYNTVIRSYSETVTRLYDHTMV